MLALDDIENRLQQAPAIIMMMSPALVSIVAVASIKGVLVLAHVELPTRSFNSFLIRCETCVCVCVCVYVCVCVCVCVCVDPDTADSFTRICSLQCSLRRKHSSKRTHSSKRNILAREHILARERILAKNTF